MKRARLDKLLSLMTVDKTTAEITTELFGPQPSGARQHFAMAEVLAYLAYFEVCGKARRIRDKQGVYVWRAL